MTGCGPADLGFDPVGDRCWRRDVRGRVVIFRSLTTLAELAPLEGLQREIFGASDLDVFPANGLILVPETGGTVIAAELEGALAGAIWGFGGFVAGQPRLLSDWMGVRVEHRSLGLGEQLKRLQAALAIADGLLHVTWTVDPLRAANARLNIAKLGATSRRYEVDRYGAYAAGLYGTMPTDRIHMEWDLGDPAVRARLRGLPPDDAHGTSRPRVEDSLQIEIPADIDSLVRTDSAAALAWRLRVRDRLQNAFAMGYVLDGFAPAGDGAAGPALLLSSTVVSAVSPRESQ